MIQRAGIILIENGNLAVIKRIRNGCIYYVIPGGGMEDGETEMETAVREAKEELGINVSELKTALTFKQNDTHSYYFVGKYNGLFGSGKGEEYDFIRDRGKYIPCWIPMEELAGKKLYPLEVKQFLLQQKAGGQEDDDE
ncbi:NUDIX domain-containing protein [Rossellomorea vietnamensis]|uniref:NUDIX domain-containing protein n=1 Tax=Rossellomorea vietnamensis TaxID=218284 RepID=A0A6I6US48_9BACI|nr:NUDIX domain-containing protein [Rossellomorea vietnamensis]QHE61863.1 NUDIX domain-containing protein [Rossellomorea vietnamensis]